MNGESKTSGNDDGYKSALFRDTDGNLRGMGMLKGVNENGRNLLRLGPVYAENFEVFKAVVSRLFLNLNAKDTI